MENINNIKNRYIIIEKIGEGAYSNVYKAKNKKTGKIVAISINKKFPVEDQYTKKYLELKKSLKDISWDGDCHPLFVCVYDVFIAIKDKKLVYCIEMEYIQGYTLENLLELKKGIDGKRLRVFLLYIFKGLAYLKSKGYEHLDLNPGNIIFNETSIKIIDVDSIVRLNTPEKNYLYYGLMDFEPILTNLSFDILRWIYRKFIYKINKKELKSMGYKDNLIKVIYEMYNYPNKDYRYFIDLLKH